MTSTSGFLISSNDVQGTAVFGLGDEQVGEIDHLMIEKVSGRVAYAIMSFGGFLGLGHSHYPVPWAALKYDTTLGGYRTGITESQLQNAPQFSDDFLERPRVGNTHPRALWCAGLLVVRVGDLVSRGLDVASRPLTKVAWSRPA